MPEPARVLVCGSRAATDTAPIFAALAAFHQQIPIGCLIQGGAQGVDEMAGIWAAANGLPVAVFRPDWRKHGRAAGPLRNQRMLDEGKPDVVIAFPGGRGTADMVRRAKAAGVPVMEVGDA